MTINARQQQILETLLVQQTASVAQLSALLDVSPVTIRNDLNQLASLGRVVRTHGGARISHGRARQELTFATRQQINAERKRRIGELAATLVEPHDAILLDSSSTAVAVAQALKQTPTTSDITVVATGIWTALELLDAPHINVVLAGGMIRGSTGSMAGSLATTILESFNFNRVFLGAAGLTLNEGLTDTHLAEVELKRAIVGRAQQVVAVVDGSKFGRVGLASFAALGRIAQIVTDETAPHELVTALRERGRTVLIAGAGR